MVCLNTFNVDLVIWLFQLSSLFQSSLWCYHSVIELHLMATEWNDGYSWWLVATNNLGRSSAVCQGLKTWKRIKMCKLFKKVKQIAIVSIKNKIQIGKPNAFQIWDVLELNTPVQETIFPKRKWISQIINSTKWTKSQLIYIPCHWSEAMLVGPELAEVEYYHMLEDDAALIWRKRLLWDRHLV